MAGDLDVADDRVAYQLRGAVVQPDVVGGPPGAKRLAAGRQLADEISQPTVIGVAPGLDPKCLNTVPRDGLPCGIELLSALIEE